MEVQGRYLDGETALSHAVTARFSTEGIAFTIADGTVVRWPTAAVRRVRHRPGRGMVQLTIDDGPATLTVNEAYAAPWLDAFHIKRKRRPVNRRLVWVMVGIVAGLSGFAIAWATSVPSLLAKMVPQIWEHEFGSQVEQQITRILSAKEGHPLKRCHRKSGVVVLNRLVERLVRDGGAGVVPTVTVLDTHIINAVALPGGRILVFQGLLDFVGGPDELAGVIAHEIGHVRHRHIMESIIRTLGLAALIDVASGGAMAGGAVAGVAKILVTTSYSRSAEREADDEAVRILQRAGISNAGLVSFFDRLAEKNGPFSGRLQIISTHPQSADRAARIRAMGLTNASPAVTRDDWTDLRRICSLVE